MRRLWVITLAGACLAASGADCARPWGDIRPRVAGLMGFSSADELRAFLADQAGATMRNQGNGFPFFLGGLMPPAAAPAPMAEATADLDAGSDGGRSADPFSTTNIQEAGVDESDIVKNDGQTIYVLDGDTIHIVQATPPVGVTELATVEIDSSGDSLYLRGSKLVALSRQYTDRWIWSSPEPDEADSILGGEWNDGAQTTVTVIDVSDPANPLVEATVRFEGNLATSRLIESRLHLVLTTQPRLPDSPVPIALAGMTLDEWLPDYELVCPDGTVRSGDIVGWQDFFRPVEPNGYSITTVVTLDVDNPAGAFESTAITADAGVIYASTEALYVTDTDYEWGVGTAREDTAIHKLSFTESGTDYVASGFVPGRPLNQYSLGEHEGYLRIATTVNQFGFGLSGPSNSVYVLGESGVELEVVGRVENIAPGEEIYAARFIGDRGFLVTFYRIDPLFTMDLSDPADPQVVGELKVPGYSDHIQLLDENHLLTIGKDAQDAGSWAWIQGVQLSIFDVSDLANPTRMDVEIIGGRGTHSEANDNPKAFNYFPARNVLAFPIDLYSAGTTGAEWGQHEFTGLYVYRVTVENGFEFLGGIPSTEEPAVGCYWWGYWGFTRGVFIGDTVYSVTESSVKAASLDDLDTIVGHAQFADAEPPPDDCWRYPDEPVVILPAGEGLR